MASQITLPSLTPREAVADALYRCTRGLDSNDRALFSSACLHNENMIFTAGPLTLSGWTSISSYFDLLFSLVTTHITSNVRVDLEDGGDRASLSCHTISYHFRPEEAFEKADRSYTAGSLYDLEMVRDEEGMWRIEQWEVRILWTTGDPGVLGGKAALDEGNEYVK